MATDGDSHVASGRPELVGELDTGRRGADHQHATVRQRARATVLARHHLVNVRPGRARAAAAPRAGRTSRWRR
jgi:hypothetical protein